MCPSTVSYSLCLRLFVYVFVLAYALSCALSSHLVELCRAVCRITNIALRCEGSSTFSGGAGSCWMVSDVTFATNGRMEHDDTNAPGRGRTYNECLLWVTPVVSSVGFLLNCFVKACQHIFIYSAFAQQVYVWLHHNIEFHQKGIWFAECQGGIGHHRKVLVYTSKDKAGSTHVEDMLWSSSQRGLTALDNASGIVQCAPDELTTKPKQLSQEGSSDVLRSMWLWIARPRFATSYLCFPMSKHIWAGCSTLVPSPNYGRSYAFMIVYAAQLWP